MSNQTPTLNPTPLNPTWISEWKPEDEAFWNSTGKTVARRNLIWSIVAEHIEIGRAPRLNSSHRR